MCKDGTFNRDENVRILEHCETALWCRLTSISWKPKSINEKKIVREIFFYYACTFVQSRQNADFMDHNIEFKGFPLCWSGLENCNCHQLYISSSVLESKRT